MSSPSLSPIPSCCSYIKIPSCCSTTLCPFAAINFPYNPSQPPTSRRIFTPASTYSAPLNHRYVHPFNGCNNRDNDRPREQLHFINPFIKQLTLLITIHHLLLQLPIDSAIQPEIPSRQIQIHFLSLRLSIPLLLPNSHPFTGISSLPLPQFSKYCNPLHSSCCCCCFSFYFSVSSVRRPPPETYTTNYPSSVIPRFVSK